MLRHAERLELRGKSNSKIALLFAASTLLAGCSSQSGASESTHVSKTTSTTTITTTTEQTQNSSRSNSGPDSLVSYLMSSGRNNHIAQAMLTFAQKLESSAQSSNGFFDAYCASLQTIESETGGGWLSQGYKPSPGQYCEYRHSQKYQSVGPHLEAEFIVEPNGQLSKQVQMVNIDDFNNSCYVEAEWQSTNFYINSQTVKTQNAVSVIYSGGGQDVRTFNATTVAQAESIDNAAVACLLKTPASF